VCTTQKKNARRTLDKNNSKNGGHVLAAESAANKKPMDSHCISWLQLKGVDFFRIQSDVFFLFEKNEPSHGIIT
jgi:hypothetical protein